MKDSKNEKTVKPNRQHYFHMIINLDSIGPKINLSTMQITSLVDLLLTSNFASQQILETILLAEVKIRGLNVAVQYGKMAVMQSGISGAPDPRGPIPYLEKSCLWLLSASSPEDAAARGLITLGVCSLSFASTSDMNTSAAFGAFLIVFFQNVLFRGPGLHIISNKILIPFIINKFICRVIIEIQIELRRKQLKLPRKLPSVKNIQWKKLFQKSKNQDEFYTSVLRIQKQKLKIFSRHFSVYLPYEKRVLIWKRSPLVEPIFL